MNKIVTCVCFCSLLSLFVSTEPVSASLLSSLLTFNTTEDKLVDQSQATYVDLDGSGGYSVGDVIYGFLKVDTITNDVGTGSEDSFDPSPNQIGLMFSAQIAEIVTTLGGLAGTTYDLKATSTAGYKLADLLETDLKTEITPLLTSESDTVFIGVSTTSADPDIISFDSIDDFTGALYDFELAGGIDPGTLSDADPDNDDFFHFLNTSSFNGEEAGGFTVFDHAFGPPTVFQPVSVDKDFSFLGTEFSFHDVSLFEGTVTAVGVPTTVDGHLAVNLTDNSNFGINAIPEPSTMAVWGLLTTVFGVAALRRRRRESLA